MKAAGRPKTQRRDPQGRFVSAKPGKSPIKANGRKGPFKPGGNKPAVPKSITAKVLDGKRDPNEVRRTYYGILTKNFTESERRDILKPGVRIVVKGMENEEMAEYVGMEDGVHVMNISSKHLDEETLTHETIHLLQGKKKGRNKEERRNLSALHGSNNLNEAMVEAETICRVKNSDSNAGYYGYLSGPKGTVREMKARDKEMIASSQCGGCLAKVQDKFGQTNIGGMRNAFDGETAKMTRKRLRFWR